jgi:hypothetical protein
MIRECLVKIERRRALADKYGIPYRTTIPRRSEASPARLWRIAVPIAALLLVTAVIVGVLLAEPIGRIVHRNREAKEIGVLVGVPESSAPPAASQNVPTTSAPANVASQGSNAAVPFSTQSPTNAAAASNSPQVAPQDIQQTQTMNAQPQATAPMVSEAASPPAVAENPASSTDETKPLSRPDEATQPAAGSQSGSRSKKKSVASTSRRARGTPGFSEDFPQRRAGSVRGRVVGITSDGRLIFRLPSGRTTIVAPDSDAEEFVPRRHRRAMIDRDEMFAPPPRSEPDYFPYD